MHKYDSANKKGSAKAAVLPAAAVAAIIFLAAGVLQYPVQKRLEVSTSSADIHLKPDIRSPVVATLYQGEILTLASPRKFRKSWNYVYFTSGSSRVLKSGYVQDSFVVKLFNPIRSIVIEGEENRRDVKRRSNSSKGIHWGMLSQNLEKINGNPNFRDGTSSDLVLGYHAKVMDLDCRVDYVFARNRLIRTEYHFLTDHEQKNRFVEDYRTLAYYFEEKYGLPVEVKTLWYDEKFKEDPSRWGQAVAAGHLLLRTRWRLTDTEVTLFLAGSQNRISLEVEYTALEAF